MKSYPKTLTPTEKYDLIKSANIDKLSDHAGEIMGLTGFVIHEEANTDGELVKVLNIRDEDNNVHATNSPVFIREFEDILEIVEDDASKIQHIEIVSKKSKGGRNYITVVWVD